MHLTVTDRKEDEVEELLYKLEKSVSIDVVSAFVDYRQLIDTNDVVEGRFMQPACLDARVAIVLTCLEQVEICGGHIQKVSADTFTSHVS